MKKTSIILLFFTLVGSLTTWAQQTELVRQMTVTLKNGEKKLYKTDDIEKISFEKEAGMITVEEIGKTSFKFSIKTGGKTYIFAAFETGYIKEYGVDLMLSTFKHFGNEDATYEWVDGIYFEFEELKVKPGCNYTILAAIWPGEGVQPDYIERVDITTLSDEHSSQTVEVTISDITANSAKVVAKPNAEISQYIVFVKEKSWVDMVVKDYGEALLQSTTERAAEIGEAQVYTKDSEYTWENLTPATDYTCIVVMTDNESKKKMELHNFSTIAE